jgi:HD superfamily phosphodiesterase
MQVVKRAGEIARHYQLNESASFILITAAWFHDIGHLFGEITHHEEIGVELMKIYLTRKEVPVPIQEEIARCIMATRAPGHPVTMLEKMLCDADNYYIGTSEFEELDNLYRRELELRLNKPITNHIDHSLQLLHTHVFYTSYCKYLLSKGKKLNIDMLLRRRNLHSI